MLPVLFDADRASAWATAAMRCAARLVQVEMHHVKAHVAGAGDAQHRVGIRTIIVELPASFVHSAVAISAILLSKRPSVLGLVIMIAAMLAGIGLQQLPARCSMSMPPVWGSVLTSTAL